MWDSIWLALLGCGVGVLSGMGVGGGSLLIVLLSAFMQVEQVTAQGVVVSRRERGTLQQSIPVRRLVQAVQPGVPQGKHHGGHGQQRQGEEQVVARQQGKKAPAYALIFQACTPVLSL